LHFFVSATFYLHLLFICCFGFGGGFFFFFPLPRQAIFFGPYRHLLGVRAIGWLARFEERMVASVEARDLEEDLASMDASIGDLVRSSETEAMARKTWDFGESVVTEKTIKKMEREGYFSIGWAEPLPAGQTVPSPAEGYAVVF
jgi:hypothetical protein